MSSSLDSQPCSSSSRSRRSCRDMRAFCSRSWEGVSSTSSSGASSSTTTSFGRLRALLSGLSGLLMSRSNTCHPLSRRRTCAIPSGMASRFRAPPVV